MRTVKEVFEEVSRINMDIKKLLNSTGFSEYDDLSMLEKENTPDGIQLYEELYQIMKHLEAASRDMDYLKQPIKYDGILKRNERDRYVLNDKELTSGCGIEVLIEDGYYDSPYWYASSIEHNGTDYYLVGKNGLELQGLRARIRG